MLRGKEQVDPEQLRNKGGVGSKQQCRSRRSDMREQRPCTISASMNTLSLRQRITVDKSYKGLWDALHTFTVDKMYTLHSLFETNAYSSPKNECA